jgi:uncharacterized membrane protein YeaQ/YmgE (transglycosylase-associated protein family)
MINIIGAIISGLVIGALARFFYPGAVEMGWVATSRGRGDFSRAGCLASVIGAIVLIFVGRLLGVGG